jgi:GntR family transcriptional regulator, transcriptional repressor for pyruvate dehydrogenase complex
MILDGTLSAGQRLPSERDLAAQLAISRASLREALSTLATLGLVHGEPHRGTFVTGSTTPLPLTSAQTWRFASRYTLPEVYQFRSLIEGYAARLATMAITDAQLLALQDIVRDFKEATRTLNFVAASQADFDLHQRIMELSGNHILADLHGTYREVLQESQRVPVARHERAWETVDEHEKLVQAIARRDPDGAEYYMRLHIARAADRVGIALGDTPQRKSNPGRAVDPAESAA